MHGQLPREEAGRVKDGVKYPACDGAERDELSLTGLFHTRRQQLSRNLYHFIGSCIISGIVFSHNSIKQAKCESQGSDTSPEAIYGGGCVI